MEITRTALIPHTATDMFRLVRDVMAYPEFLSWCVAARLHQETSTMQLATLEITLGGLRQSFTTRNRLVTDEMLVLSLVEGPFQRLSGEWQFRQLSGAGSKVSLNLSFEMNPGLIASAFARGFAHVADRLVRDFVARADHIYGPQLALRDEFSGRVQ